jgi:hypothetical protein
MFTDPPIAFAMFSFCYAQWPSYLQCIIFPSPSILQCYTKFNVRTIAMLEKLLKSRSFGTTVSHLAHCQVTFPISLGGLSLPLMV